MAYGLLDADGYDGWVSGEYHPRGTTEEGLAWMAEREPLWSTKEHANQAHIWWHKALFHISMGDNQAVFDAYDHHVWGIEPDYSQDQVGAVSLLAALKHLAVVGCDHHVTVFENAALLKRMTSAERHALREGMAALTRAAREEVASRRAVKTA